MTKDVKLVNLDKYNVEYYCEFTGIRISNIIIIAVYRPSSSDLETFLIKLNLLLANITKKEIMLLSLVILRQISLISKQTLSVINNDIEFGLQRTIF